MKVLLIDVGAEVGFIRDTGVPIVASDSVTYTVTAVGRHGRDTAVIAIPAVALT
jgi:hypothetical protein